MELLERYLQAVKFWLPKKQQDDILAELKEDIESEMEEMESGLGRKMTGSEMEALLKRRGRPMMVAMRFQPKRFLIGPGLFPMYIFVLKVAVLCYLVPWALAGLVLLLFGGSRPVGEVVGGLWGSLWVTLAFQFSIITLVFAALEQTHSKSGFQENWNPGALPRVRPPRDPYRVARTGSLVEIVMSLIFLAWWIRMPQGFPFAWGLDKAGIHWAWGSVWQDFHHHFFYLVIVLTLINVCVAVVNLIRPYWTRPTLVIRGTINASVATMAYFVVRAHWPEMKSEWILLTGTHPAVAQAEMLSRWTNLSIYSALAISTVVAGIQALVEYVRAILWRNSGSKLKAAAALVLVAASLGASGTKAFPTEGTTRNTAYSAQLAKMSLPAFTGEAALSVRKDFEITFTFETNESWRVKLEFQPDCEAHGFLGRFLSGLNRVI